MMYNTGMNVTTFDTYRFIKRLKDAGISEEHAAAEADALAEALHVNLETVATKADLKAEIAKLESRMIKFVFAMLVAQTALTVSLIKLL